MVDVTDWCCNVLRVSAERYCTHITLQAACARSSAHFAGLLCGVSFQVVGIVQVLGLIDLCFFVTRDCGWMLASQLLNLEAACWMLLISADMSFRSAQQAAVILLLLADKPNNSVNNSPPIPVARFQTLCRRCVQLIVAASSAVSALGASQAVPGRAVQRATQAAVTAMATVTYSK
jgi:hypothetical protein